MSFSFHFELDPIKLQHNTSKSLWQKCDKPLMSLNTFTRVRLLRTTIESPLMGLPVKQLFVDFILKITPRISRNQLTNPVPWRVPKINENYRWFGDFSTTRLAGVPLISWFVLFYSRKIWWIYLGVGWDAISLCCFSHFMRSPTSR